MLLAHDCKKKKKKTRRRRKEEKEKRDSLRLRGERQRKFIFRKATLISQNLSLSPFARKKRMSGRPTDQLEPQAKKRGSERQLTKNDVGDSEDESGGDEVKK